MSLATIRPFLEDFSSDICGMSSATLTNFYSLAPGDGLPDKKKLQRVAKRLEPIDLVIPFNQRPQEVDSMNLIKIRMPSPGFYPGGA